MSRESVGVAGQTRGRPWPREREGPAPSGAGGTERSGRFAGHPVRDRGRDASIIGVRGASQKQMCGFVMRRQGGQLEPGFATAEGKRKAVKKEEAGSLTVTGFEII